LNCFWICSHSELIGVWLVMLQRSAQDLIQRMNVHALKTLLRREKMRISGKKQDLVKRAIEYLNSLDQTRRAEFESKVEGLYRSDFSVLQPNRLLSTGIIKDSGDDKISFKPTLLLPFYHQVEEILNFCIRSCLHQIPFKLSSSIPEDERTIIVLCCCKERAHELENSMFVPRIFAVKVNEKEIEMKFIDAKNRTAQPIDITRHCEFNDAKLNTISFYAPMNQTYISIVRVRRITIETLVDEIKARPIVQGQVGFKQKTDDVLATSAEVSLQCPLGKIRIQSAFRSKKCTHTQCFDGMTFLEMNVRISTWKCPVCNKSSPFSDLVFDTFFDEILKKVDENVDTVIIDSTGEWRLPSNFDDRTISLEDESQNDSKSSSSGKKYVEMEEEEEDDDDIPLSYKLKNKSGNKVQVVVDLTDDDDDPPAPTSTTSTTTSSPSSLLGLPFNFSQSELIEAVIHSLRQVKPHSASSASPNTASRNAGNKDSPITLD